ncbi:MAG: class IV adenylate cyclase [Bacteroidetes bacterium]|nr:class IV adenylate cyclase [Bacteroidota bacterium]
MIEVEIRAKVDNFDNIKNKLGEIKAALQGSIHQIDKIFGHPMFLDSKNMIIEGGIVPRIRSINNKYLLEFKEIRRTSGGIELSSELNNIGLGVEFLNKLSFKEAFTIDKKRESYKYKNFVIDLDNVDKLGNFIEIERIVNLPEEKDSARQECINLLALISPNSKIENKKIRRLNAGID